MKTYDYPNGLAVQTERDKEKGNWQWFYRDAGDRWKEIHELIPDSPQNVEDIRSYGESHVLAILGTAKASKAGDALIWQYYYHDRNGEWRPLSGVLEAARGGIFALKTFAGERGIAIQTMDSATGRHGATWTVEFRTETQGWTPLLSLSKSHVSEIWNVAPYGKDLGVGIQSAIDRNDQSHAFKWEWFVRESDAWIPLQEFVPHSPTHIWDVYCEDLSLGIAIQEDEASIPEKVPFAWDWLLRSSAGEWVEVAQIVKLPQGFPDRGNPRSVSFPEKDDSDLRRDLLTVSDRDGNRRWFLRTKGDWLPISEDTLESSH
jgi:hypothetical protein